MNDNDIFLGPGSDPAFLLAKVDPRLEGVRAECQRLWGIHRPHVQGHGRAAASKFVRDFSENFHQQFWEMYLGEKLTQRYPKLEFQKSGPDFISPGPPRVAVEATVASKGTGADAVPDLDDGDDEQSEGLVPFDQCVLRITEALHKKSTRNGAKKEAEKGAYVVAINLPYPQAWLGGRPPISALATLGAGGVTIDMNTGRLIVSANPAITKKSGESVSTAKFLSGEYKHISAVLVASVSPFTSAYDDPAIEVLHNPTANQRLPRGWFPFGTEYWLDGVELKSKQIA